MNGASVLVVIMLLTRWKFSPMSTCDARWRDLQRAVDRATGRLNSDELAAVELLVADMGITYFGARK